MTASLDHERMSKQYKELVDWFASRDWTLEEVSTVLVLLLGNIMRLHQQQGLSPVGLEHYLNGISDYLMQKTFKGSEAFKKKKDTV
jgi:hypothetical protein